MECVLFGEARQWFPFSDLNKLFNNGKMLTMLEQQNRLLKSLGNIYMYLWFLLGFAFKGLGEENSLGKRKVIS